MPINALLQRLPRRQAASYRIPEGRRVYAIGDIHGRLDLLDALLGMIDSDDRERGASHTTLIFLGDLVDRGPDSRGVVQRLLDLSRTSRETRFLLGNHEDVFLRAVKGDPRATRFLIRIGGRQV
jgi:serine/threonine protein phosphatase 1